MTFGPFRHISGVQRPLRNHTIEIEALQGNDLQISLHVLIPNIIYLLAFSTVEEGLSGYQTIAALHQNPISH